MQSRSGTGSEAHMNPNAATSASSNDSKPNFFVFQNKMNSRPSLHN